MSGMQQYMSVLGNAQSSESTSSEPYTKEVIGIMGQSNIDGRNNLIYLPTDVQNPSPIVKHYLAAGWDDWDSTQPPVCFTFASNYSADTIMLNRLATYLGRTIYAVKKSRGGTGFKQITGGNGDWNVASTEFDDHYWIFMRRLANTKNYIEKIEGLNFKLKFLWCDIGETDSATSDSATFKTDFKNFIQSVRDYVGDPNLPIIHRKLQLDQGSVYQWFLDAQEDFAAGEISNYYLIRGNYTLQDAYHLDYSSTESYANTVLNLVKDWFQ